MNADESCLKLLHNLFARYSYYFIIRSNESMIEKFYMIYSTYSYLYFIVTFDSYNPLQSIWNFFNSLPLIFLYYLFFILLYDDKWFKFDSNGYPILFTIPLHTISIVWDIYVFTNVKNANTYYWSCLHFGFILFSRLNFYAKESTSYVLMQSLILIWEWYFLIQL